MYSILETYQKALNTQDPFELWETELQLRIQLRTLSVPAALKINSAAELDLLFRSLFFWERKYDFYSILFTNLNHLEALKWITSARPGLIEDFLSYLPWYVKIHRPEPSYLQFLINLYQEQYREYYSRIVSVLDLSCCDYLLTRTANPGLRNLLSLQHQQLLADREDAFYGLSGSKLSKSHDSIFGNKADLIIESINAIANSRSVHYHEPYCSERFQMLLQCAEKSFECGLVEDSLAILLDTYQDYQEKNRLVDVLEDEKIHKYFHRLLRKAIPIYVVITRQTDRFQQAQEIYRQFFPRIAADPGSMTYLQLLDGINKANYSMEEHILLELLALCTKIGSYRPGEAELLNRSFLHAAADPAWLQGVANLASRKITSLPCETYTLLELIRLLDKRGIIKLSAMNGRMIYCHYFDLWTWLPSRFFINDEIAGDITPLLVEADRQQIQQIVSLVEYYDDATLKADLSTRPDLFKNRESAVRRNILWGKFLGVL